MTLALNKEIAIQLIQEEQESTPFPVPLKEVNNWLQSTRKDNPLEYLTSKGFTEGIDFVGFPEIRETNLGELTVMEYYLTVDCCKNYCMMSNKPAGAVIRRYFIEAEKELRAIISTQQQQPVIDPTTATILGMQKSHESAMALIAQSLGMSQIEFREGLANTSNQIEELASKTDLVNARVDKAGQIFNEFQNKLDNIESKVNEYEVPEGHYKISDYFQDQKLHKYTVKDDWKSITRIVGKAASAINRKNGTEQLKVKTQGYNSMTGVYTLEVIEQAVKQLIDQEVLIATQKRVKIHLSLS